MLRNILLNWMVLDPAPDGRPDGAPALPVLPSPFPSASTGRSSSPPADARLRGAGAQRDRAVSLSSSTGAFPAWLSARHRALHHPAVPARRRRAGPFALRLLPQGARPARRGRADASWSSTRSTTLGDRLRDRRPTSWPVVSCGRLCRARAAWLVYLLVPAAAACATGSRLLFGPLPLAIAAMAAGTGVATWAATNYLL